MDFGLGDWCPPQGVNLCPTVITDTALCFVDANAMAELAFEMDKPTGPWEDQAWEARTAFRRALYQRRQGGAREPDRLTPAPSPRACWMRRR